MDRILEKYLPTEELETVQYFLFGTLTSQQTIELPFRSWEEAYSLGIELRAFSLLNGSRSSIDEASIVRIGLCQLSLPAAATDNVQFQKCAVLEKGLKMLEVAHLAGVQIFCFQEFWTMPMGFCTGQKLPWVEFAENPFNGTTTETLRSFAKKYEMVIISPILERGEEDDLLWNTAVVIDANGDVLGIYRKFHIPIAGNESAYFQTSDIGIPVFQTKYAKVGISMCFDRHFSTHALALSLGGTEIVFNPAASVSSFSEHLWPIESRYNALSNGYFVGAINRVGREDFGNSKIREFYGSSYITSPTGVRTPSLSNDKSGILVSDICLEDCIPHQKRFGNEEASKAALAKFSEAFRTKTQVSK